MQKKVAIPLGAVTLYLLTGCSEMRVEEVANDAFQQVGDWRLFEWIVVVLLSLILIGLLPPELGGFGLVAIAIVVGVKILYTLSAPSWSSFYELLRENIVLFVAAFLLGVICLLMTEIGHSLRKKLRKARASSKSKPEKGNDPRRWREDRDK